MTVIIKWEAKHDRRLAKLINRYRRDSVVKRTVSRNLPDFYKHKDISPSLLKYEYEPDAKETTLFEIEAYHKIQKLTSGIEEGFAPPTNALINNFKIIICLLFVYTSLSPLLQQVKIDGKFPLPMNITYAIASGTTMFGSWLFQPEDANDLLLPLSYGELFQVLIGPCLVSISFAFFLISFEVVDPVVTQGLDFSTGMFILIFTMLYNQKIGGNKCVLVLLCLITLGFFLYLNQPLEPSLIFSFGRPILYAFSCVLHANLAPSIFTKYNATNEQKSFYYVLGQFLGFLVGTPLVGVMKWKINFNSELLTSIQLMWVVISTIMSAFYFFFVGILSRVDEYPAIMAFVGMTASAFSILITAWQTNEFEVQNFFIYAQLNIIGLLINIDLEFEKSLSLLQELIELTKTLISAIPLSAVKKVFEKLIADIEKDSGTDSAKKVLKEKCRSRDWSSVSSVSDPSAEFTESDLSASFENTNVVKDDVKSDQVSAGFGRPMGGESPEFYLKGSGEDDDESDEDLFEILYD